MEQTNLLNEFNEPTYVYATTAQRLVNYLIDVVVFYVLLIVVGLLLGMLMGLEDIASFLGFYYLMIFVLFIGYYTLMEGAKGKTIGKMLTKTSVVTESGEPLTYKDAFLRSLCRIVPFEFISAFIGPKMWHDQWTKTLVVKDN